MKTHQVKVDGFLATTDDEGEKTADEEASNVPVQLAVDKQSTQSSIKVVESAAKLAKSSKPSAEEVKSGATTAKGAKGKDAKKEKTDSNKPSQEPVTQMSDHQANESITIDEPLSNRPPTPPKPKVYLPPLDVAPFIR